MLPPKREQFKSIKDRMIVSFSLLFLFIFGSIAIMDLQGIPFTAYPGRHKQLKSEAFYGLNLIADLKKERLLRWIKEHRDDAHVISENIFTATHIARISAEVNRLKQLTPNKNDLWRKITNQKDYLDILKYLEDLKVVYGVYDRIKIADAERGIIFVSTDKGELGNNVSDSAYFSGPIQTDDNYESDAVFAYQREKPILYFSHVVKNKRDKTIAVLIMEVNTDDIIKQILHIGEELGKKGEALLVNQKGKIITSLKYPLPDGSKAEPLKYQIKSKPAALAARGEEGIIEAEDYRGEPVLAAYRYLKVNPEWGWGMVVKRDKSELFAPLRQNIIYTLSIGFAGIFAFVGFTIYLSKKITGPIHSLSLTAAKVSEGDLDARTPISGQDEVGTLALTFNSMVERIQNWQKELEEKVSSRTAELTTTNETLKNEVHERKRVEEQLRKYQERLRSLASELSMAEERERHHIATELHDNIVQNLAFSKIKLGFLKKKSVSLELDGAFEEVIKLIDQTIQSSRFLTFELSPPILYELGFEPAVEWLSEQFSDQHNISITFKDDGQPKPLEDETKILLFRSVRELLVNTIKHAQAQKVQVSLERKEQTIQVKVEDDGIGFEPAAVLPRTDRTGGFGLFSVRDRLDYHGGRLELESTPGKGTRATMTAPLTNDNQN